MIARQVGAVEATVVALVVFGTGIAAGAAAATGGRPGAAAAAAVGAVEACARGNATSAASTLTAISNRTVRRESDRLGGDRDGMNSPGTGIQIAPAKSRDRRALSTSNGTPGANLTWQTASWVTHA